MNCQDVLRRVRIRGKILWLAFRVWQHTRKIRAFKARVEAHMKKHQNVLDAQDMFLLGQLKRLEEQEIMLQHAARTTILGWRVLGDE
jgi:hypothetical protein